MKITSFGRSFLSVASRNDASASFIRRVIRAAKKRHPDLIASRHDRNAIIYTVPSQQNCTLLLITW